MARLLEIQDVSQLPGRVTLSVGDALFIHATGARIVQGANTSKPSAMEVLGPFTSGFLGPAGQSVMPAGPPTVVICRTTGTGLVVLEVTSGDPWGHVRTTSVDIHIDALPRS